MEAEKLKKDSRSRRANTMSSVDMNFTISSLHFKSMEGTFRITSSKLSEGILFKLEKLKSPSQWQITVKDISSHGAALPSETVFSVFKSALERISAEDPEGKSHLDSSKDAVVDLEATDDGTLALYLDIPLFGTILTYTFDLLPVAREQLDILESLLRDAYDEINDLKNQLPHRAATPLISLRSSTACSNSRNVIWDQPYNNTDPKYFEYLKDRATICVKQAGVYQVNVRLTGNGQQQTVSLRSNGTVIASTTFSHNITANITTAINDIFNLEAQSRLQVLYTGDGATTTDPTFSQFSIIKLA